MVVERNPMTKLWLVKLGDKPSQVDTNRQASSLHHLSKLLFALGTRPSKFATLPQRINF